MKESYPNFEGQIVNGERVPCKNDIRNMPDKEFAKAHPFAKKCCSNCRHLYGALSWWCSNEEAIEYRGTRQAGVIFCTFWEPDWSEIPSKYKVPEFGYQRSLKRSFREKVKAVFNFFFH